MEFYIKQPLKYKIIISYLFIASLIGCIVYAWYDETKKLISFEIVNKEINDTRQQIYNIILQITELSLLGENILEYSNADSEIYLSHRMAVDSMLCDFKRVYPAERIDSVRHLLKDKEKQMFAVRQTLNEQETINDKIAQQVPIIIQKSTQEESKKQKRKGFLGLFGKKEKAKPTATTTMLHTLNRDVINRQQMQNRRLSEYADSLSVRNVELNRQLQSFIHWMDDKIQSDLQKREKEIAAMREKSFIHIGSLTGFVLLLLIISYIIIHRDAKRIQRYKRRTTNLIRQLHESDLRNKGLIISRKKAMHTITHELRTPLTAIHGYAELLYGNEDENTSRYARNILQASGRMIAMLNALLSFFRLDSGKEQPNIAPFRLQDVADSLQAEFVPLAEAKDLKLTVECAGGAVLTGDKERIMQIGGNLLANAVKFTQAGSVSLEMGHENDMLSIIVEDTGSGMTEEEQQRVFGAFERLSNAATQDGFGLGLSIVKHIVDMLGGTISVESEKGKGSRFSVEIPMRIADAISEETDDGNKAHPEKSYSVIALDDNGIVISMMKDMYAHVGVHCDTFCDVGDMMEALRTRHYDFLITDLKMPEINGFEVLELLRSSHIGNSQVIPVVVATASESCDEEELLAKGFAACLFKPFSMSELFAVSEKCLSSLPPDKEEQPDLTFLLAYGDREAMLDRLIAETEKDMQAIGDAGERCDRKALDEWTHRLRSSWAVIRADKPLWALHGLLHRETECSDAELGNAVNDVLRMGTAIIGLAKEERRQAE